VNRTLLDLVEQWRLVGWNEGRGWFQEDHAMPPKHEHVCGEDELVYISVA
jgi:hypothetical protein